MTPGFARPVLLVDDDPDDRFLLRQAWEESGRPTPLVELTDGAAATAYLSGNGEYADRAAHPLPAFILLDVNLPGVSGLSLLDWIRRSSSVPLVPVLMLSASAAPGDVCEAYRRGANTYLVKPSSLAALTEMLKDVSRYWLGRAQLP